MHTFVSTVEWFVSGHVGSIGNRLTQKLFSRCTYRYNDSIPVFENFPKTKSTGMHAVLRVLCFIRVDSAGVSEFFNRIPRGVLVKYLSRKKNVRVSIGIRILFQFSFWAFQTPFLVFVTVIFFFKDFHFKPFHTWKLITFETFEFCNEKRFNNCQQLYIIILFRRSVENVFSYPSSVQILISFKTLSWQLRIFQQCNVWRISIHICIIQKQNLLLLSQVNYTRKICLIDFFMPSFFLKPMHGLSTFEKGLAIEMSAWWII